MQLQLKFPPTPAYASKHAQLAADAAKNVEGIDLDFTPASLKNVDAILTKFHKERLTIPQIGSTVFSFGCYVGEVMIRNHGGRWVTPQEVKFPGSEDPSNNIMLVQIPSKGVWNPIGKAFKLLEHGDSESLAYFYTVALKA